MKKTWLPFLLLPLLVSATIFSAQAPYDTAQGFEGLNIGAGLAIGLAAIGAGVAVGMAAAAGIGVLTERRDMFGTILIFVAIGEGIAVYGILFAVLMLFGKF
ncbi:ATP synthase subunit K [Sulfurisphaera tokodaii]|uniref:A-type ATP synthase subunit K n=2 Tax=Sulfurisphaera tokodaii TaxID=111955 RepID=AATK_SULTO|nr:ATP synthase subunit K [Sulfurisphaera tokodaii]P62021.1 RecName: Full=Membrane-associated ATPase C chain; AltName: Full=Sul-ATPase proteolipid chain [Sulfurisphaera tokodaii str. 7]AAA72703.1 ATP synthase P subunit [Sulfolobus acidocaldarius]BAK54576.1 membrane-associated ATPase proteolipid subunit [Sulfurisphaera tokodaii str. 7]HII73677.1 V-type ATP synthase subunit K [Sulfurisphaera tokodaii]